MNLIANTIVCLYVHSSNTARDTTSIGLNEAYVCNFEKAIHDGWFNKKSAALDEVYKQVTSNKVSGTWRVIFVIYHRRRYIFIRRN